MATAQPSPRASLLSGLRTGGVRSVSVPQTAAPAGSFNIPHRMQSPLNQARPIFPEEEQMDQLGDMASHSAYGRGPRDLSHLRQQPRTASLDCARLLQQQQDLLLQRPQVARAAVASGPAMYESVSSDVQAMQMHMMQMEIMRLQVSSLWSSDLAYFEP